MNLITHQVKKIARLRILLAVLCTPFFYSCVSTKNITYFQGPGVVDTIRYTTLNSIEPRIPKIQPDDILAVTVSSLSEESNLVFNFANINPLITSNFPGGTNTGMARQQPLGYLVDPKGFIDMPLIGRIQVNGLALEEAGTKIQGELTKFLKEPTVNVRQLNHKFTIIGEVARPGVYNLLDNHTTLPEILGTAGDMTIFGRRDNVMIMRTTGDKRELVKLDLTSRKVLESPYYYIQNNDVVYVEATKGKITSSDRTIQLIPIVTGIATTTVLLLNLIFKK